jgi:predicted aspartyl protease
MYEVGEGVEKDYQEAATWFRQAAGQGSQAAQRQLDYLIKSGKVAAAPSQMMPSMPISVPMVMKEGILGVNVLLNDALSLTFTVDSGASDVSIPVDVVMTLTRTSTLRNDDFLGNQTYKLVDGSTIPSQTFRIKTIKVGGKVVKDVTGSVSPVAGDLLLRQSFLSRFNSWSIDNQRQLLILN